MFCKFSTIMAERKSTVTWASIGGGGGGTCPPTNYQEGGGGDIISNVPPPPPPRFWGCNIIHWNEDRFFMWALWRCVDLFSFFSLVRDVGDVRWVPLLCVCPPPPHGLVFGLTMYGQTVVRLIKLNTETHPVYLAAWHLALLCSTTL